MNLHAVLARVTPSADEDAAMDAVVGRLEAAVQAVMDDLGLPGRASVQGSVAKGTWLAGSTDLDLFMLLDPALDEAALKQAAQDVGSRVLEGARKMYAQHPYLIGAFEGLDVDLVPAYAVAAAGARMSAVDRTPFHTAWVREHLDDAGAVRLAKQWCKGVGVYGADTATGGFSGYLVEVLVVLHRGFEGFIDWLAADARPRRLAHGDDEVDDDVSPLVVVDPVDAARNCAAAVHAGTLAAAIEAARAYRNGPDERFFFPRPAQGAPAARLKAALADQGAVWLGVQMTPKTDRLDIVLPQFQRAGRMLTEALERDGFPVRRHRVDQVDGVSMQWVIDDVHKPATRIHRGPAAHQEPNARKFREKWQEAADAAGPVHEDDGRLAVEVHERIRTPVEALRHHLKTASLGKHVAAALQDHRLHDAPPGGSWAPIVTDFILDRRPWQR